MSDTARVRFAAGVVLCGLVLAGCSSGGDDATPRTPAVSASSSASASPETFTLTGTLTLSQTFLTYGGTTGEDCYGTGGFDDLKTGAQVIVSDSGGATVALGSVSTATANFDVTPRTCLMSFFVDDVPGGKGFYGVAVGSRDPYKITEAAAHAKVELTIG